MREAPWRLLPRLRLTAAMLAFYVPGEIGGGGIPNELRKGKLPREMVQEV